MILTWLPVYVAGENHGDHQAAGVIATEAFDLAGDPTAFPEQISPPRDRQNISNLTEGLQPWQPKKLYYFSDASHTDFLEGKGPRYETTGVSPSRGVPYYKLAAEEMSFHLTQGDTGQLATQAIAKGDFKYFEQPVLLLLGKSLVKSSVTGDIFEGVVEGGSPFAPVPGYRPAKKEGLSMELGGPWSFYREFWKAHAIDHLAALLSTPEVAIAPGEHLHLPLVIHNATAEARNVELSATIPKGWSTAAGQAIYPVDAHNAYPVETVLASPTQGEPAWQTVVWKAEVEGKAVGSSPSASTSLQVACPNSSIDSRHRLASMACATSSHSANRLARSARRAFSRSLTRDAFFHADEIGQRLLVIGDLDFQARDFVFDLAPALLHLAQLDGIQALGRPPAWMRAAPAGCRCCFDGNRHGRFRSGERRGPPPSFRHR